MLALTLALTLSLASCVGNGDDNNPSENPDEPPVTDDPGNGDEPVDPPVDEDKVSYTVVVLDDKGDPVSGVRFQICSGENCVPKKTGADGKFVYEVTGEEAEWEYTAKLMSVPDGYAGDTENYYEFDENNTVTFYIHKQPDGSLEYPFFLSDEDSEVTVPGSASYHYRARGSEERYVVFEGQSFEIKYSGETLTPTDGKIQIAFVSDSIYELCDFEIVNLSETENTVAINIEYVPGSSSAPYAVESLAAPFTANVVNGHSVHYSWTADKDGVLVIISENIANNMFLYNTTSYAQSGTTEGAYAQHVAVKTGDEIQINVSAIFPDNAAADAAKEIVFSLACYAGTEAEPLPVYVSGAYYRVTKGASLTLTADAGKTVTVEGVGASVSFDGQTLTADASGKITFTLSEGKTAFTLTNTTDENNEYEIKLA